MPVRDQKGKLQVRAAVCLLFFCICGMLSSCRGGDAGEAPVRAAGSLDVWFFACSEDADSILLQTDDVNIMIDTGIEGDSPALLQKLEELQVDKIDLLILTHPDKDHIGGAVAVLDTYPVDQVIQTSCEKGSQEQEALNRKLEGLRVSVPDAVQEIRYGELQLTIYPPEKETYGSSNNYSIAVLADYEGSRFFFAGDAKKKRIGELLDENLPQVDVYKVAHHGRDNGNSDDLIEALQPDYAVVTAAAAEKETEDALTETGAEICSTYGRDVHFTAADGILDVE